MTVINNVGFNAKLQKAKKRKARLNKLKEIFNADFWQVLLFIVLSVSIGILIFWR